VTKSKSGSRGPRAGDGAQLAYSCMVVKVLTDTADVRSKALDPLCLPHHKCDENNDNTYHYDSNNKNSIQFIDTKKKKKI